MISTKETNCQVLVAALASFSSSLLLARLGRRPTIILASVAFLVGSIGLGAANSKFMLLASRCALKSFNAHLFNFFHLFLSRAIVGVGVGLASAAVPLYIGECSTAEDRWRIIGNFFKK